MWVQFLLRAVWGKTFSHRKLKKKIRALVIRIRHFKKNAWSVTSVRMWRIFPPKDLKNTAPKIRMRQFFFSKIVIFQSTLPIKWTFSLVVLYHHLLLLKGTAFLIFYSLSIYIYSVNHKRFKFNKVFILLNYLQSQGKLLKWY